MTFRSPVPALRCWILLGCVFLACGERTDAETPRMPESGPRPAGAPPSAPAPEPPSGRAEPSTQVLPAALLEPEPATSIVLAAGGDVNFGRECGQAILSDPAYDPFTGLSEAWTSADARFVNLESQLSDQNGVTQSPGNRLVFCGPPGGADVLSRARISLVSTANNHAWDYGKRGLLETIENLQRAQVPFAGTGRNVDEAYRPVVVRVKGLSVALFAVTQIWNQGAFASHAGRNHVAWADAGKLKARIQQARREHDFVLVSYHGGEEYIDAPVDKTRRFVKAVMALGVDAFLGHHPHVPQGIGWVKSRPVMYSLGNLVFAGHDNRPWTKQSFFVRLTLRKGAASELSACPYSLDGHRPRSLDKAGQALEIERFRQHLIGLSTSVGGSSVGLADALGCVRVTAKE